MTMQMGYMNIGNVDWGNKRVRKAQGHSDRCREISYGQWNEIVTPFRVIKSQKMGHEAGSVLILTLDVEKSESYRSKTKLVNVAIYSTYQDTERICLPLPFVCRERNQAYWFDPAIYQHLHLCCHLW